MDSSGVFSKVVAVWKLKATEWTSYTDGALLLKVQQILFYRTLDEYHCGIKNITCRDH